MDDDRFMTAWAQVGAIWQLRESKDQEERRKWRLVVDFLDTIKPKDKKGRPSKPKQKRHAGDIQ